jgi:hypothetical protein
MIDNKEVWLNSPCGHNLAKLMNASSSEDITYVRLSNSGITGETWIHSILLHNFGTGNQYKFASRLKANQLLLSSGQQIAQCFVADFE